MSETELMRKVIDETKRVVDAVDAGQLANQSPCEDWDVRAVINHLTGGSLMFAEAIENGSIPDERVGELMTADLLGDDYKGAFGLAADRAVAAFDLPGALDTIVKLPFGEMPGSVALQIAVFDVTVHALDVAHATGQSKELDPGVLTAAWEYGNSMIGPEMRAPGVFEAAQDVSADAPMGDRLLAFSGRKV